MTWPIIRLKINFITVLFQPPSELDEVDEWFTLMQDNPASKSQEESKQTEFEFMPNTSHSVDATNQTETAEPKVSRFNLNGTPSETNIFFMAAFAPRQKLGCLG